MNSIVVMLGVVNGQQISVIQNGQKLVPIKPICDALDIDMESQRKRINEDPILSSTTVLSTAVAADGKNREMQCLPLKYVFGWLFRIDSRNVKEEARETVINYQMACYDLLYDYFAGYAEFVEVKQKYVEQLLEKLDGARKQFHSAKEYMGGVQSELNEVRKWTFDSYKLDSAQLGIFDNEM